jgi:Domain of unknown function (DUF397)
MRNTGGRSVTMSAAAEWVKSTYSGPTGGNCVEVAFLDGQVAVRNSRHADGPSLVFTGDEWRAFLCGARDGEFDLTGPADGQPDPTEMDRMSSADAAGDSALARSKSNASAWARTSRSRSSI